MPIMSPPFELDFVGRAAPLPSLRETVQPLIKAFPERMTLASIETESAIRFGQFGISAADLHAIADAARRADRLLVSEPVRPAGAAPAAIVRVLSELASNRQEVDAALATVADVAALLGASKAVHEVLAERRRQISVEGFDLQYDAEHGSAQLAAAAACYAAWDHVPIEHLHCKSEGQPAIWPWWPEHFKPKDDRRNLVRAAALLLAALELDDAQREAAERQVQHPRAGDTTYGATGAAA